MQMPAVATATSVTVVQMCPAAGAAEAEPRDSSSFHRASWRGLAPPPAVALHRQTTPVQRGIR